MNESRLAAFVEYVLRPLSEDWRLIIEELKKLHWDAAGEAIHEVAFYAMLWHLVGEVIRGISMVAITWIICQTLLKLWPFL